MTAYVEQTILLHVMDGELDEARKKLADFYPTELADFEDHVDNLLVLIQARRQAVRDA